MEQAVVYARYSSNNQTENSIEGQVEAARNYATQHGYNIIHVYADRAKTGTNDQREEFQRMLSDCKKHKFSVIIVWKVDRFGRNREEITFNKYKCKKEGVRVEYVAENLGDGNEAVILESVLEGMAEYFSKQLSTNVKRGLEASRKKGNYVGSAPFGYIKRDGKLIEVPEELEVVRTIFELYAAGESSLEIRDELGMPDDHVLRIIRNEKYKSVVDPNTYETAVNRYRSRVKRHRSGEEMKKEYKLTSKLTCTCGRHMVGSSTNCKNGKKYHYYRCHKNCGNRVIRRDLADELVIEAVKEHLSTPESIEVIVEGIWAKYQEMLKEERVVSAPEKELEAVSKRLTRLYKAVEDGMPWENIKERVAELESQKSAILEQIGSTKPRINLTKDAIRKYLSRKDIYENDLLLIEMLVRDVVYDGEKLDIYLNVSEDFCIQTQLPWLLQVSTKGQKI